MKKTILYLAVPALTLAVCMVYLLLLGERDASAVRESVVRFHVVAASDSEEDQALKLKVRDGIFRRIEELFARCQNQAEALEKAELHRSELESAAEQILLENGDDTPVTLEIGTRYFPTKTYGALSFPAGQYQAVSIRIGEAKGQNFWCVLYPALCIAPAVAEEKAEEELTATFGQEAADFLKKTGKKQEIKFFLVEQFERMMQKFIKR